jgi:hypothetical protein
MGDIVVSNLVVENRLFFLFEKSRRLLLLSLLHKFTPRREPRCRVLMYALYALVLPVRHPLPFPP